MLLPRWTTAGLIVAGVLATGACGCKTAGNRALHDTPTEAPPPPYAPPTQRQTTVSPFTTPDDSDLPTFRETPNDIGPGHSPAVPGISPDGLPTAPPLTPVPEAPAPLDDSDPTQAPLPAPPRGSRRAVGPNTARRGPWRNETASWTPSHLGSVPVSPFAQPVTLSQSVEIVDVRLAMDSATGEPLPEDVSAAKEPAAAETRPVLQAVPEAVAQRLEISRATLCSAVRGFDDVTEVDAKSLAAGQPVVLYVALKGIGSRSVDAGQRSRTLSTLEIYSGDRMLVRQSLGTANDLAPERRKNFFLSHLMQVPSLREGAYTFRIRIFDLQADQAVQQDLPVTIRAGQIRPM